MDFTLTNQRPCFSIPIREDNVTEATETFALRLTKDPFIGVQVTLKEDFEVATVLIQDSDPPSGINSSIYILAMIEI